MHCATVRFCPPPIPQGMVYEEQPFIGDCQKFVQCLAAVSVRRYGAQFVHNAEAVQLHSEADRITGVQTADGREFTADLVVLANGAWAPRLAATAGVSLPVIPTKGYTIEMPLPEKVLHSTAALCPLPPPHSRCSLPPTPLTQCSVPPPPPPFALIGRGMGFLRSLRTALWASGELPTAGGQPPTPSG